MNVRQPEMVLAQVLTQYDRPEGFNQGLLGQFTGVEIIRRLIGLAQLIQQPGRLRRRLDGERSGSAGHGNPSTMVVF